MELGTKEDMMNTLTLVALIGVREVGKFRIDLVENYVFHIIKPLSVAGSWIDMSKTKTIGQVQKVARAESPVCLATFITGKTKI